jgi:hypothetical protein
MTFYVTVTCLLETGTVVQCTGGQVDVNEHGSSHTDTWDVYVGNSVHRGKVKHGEPGRH